MIEIRKARKNEVENVENVLNEASKNLLDKGIKQWPGKWDEKYIKEEFEKSRVFAVLFGETIAGCFFLKKMKEVDFLQVKQGDLYLYQIAFKPFFQGKGMGLEVINYCRELIKDTELSLYLDCWAGNEKLRNFYGNAGFEFLGNFPEENYFISVFRLQGN